MDLPDEQQKIWGRMLPAYADEYKHRFSPDGEDDAAPPLVDTKLANFQESKSSSDAISIVQHFLRQAARRSNPGDPISTNRSDEGTVGVSDGTIAVSSSPLYRSVPIPDYDSQIRLVELLPGNDDDDDPIELNLFVADTVQGQEYEALSYVWGSRDADVNVTMNGSPFEVSANLAVALRSLRRKVGESGRTLWIDALCIDQGHIAEKSSQVALMGEIYRRASNVVIFLGDRADDSDLVMQYLSQPAAEYGEDVNPAPESSTTRAERSSGEFGCGCRDGTCRVRQRIKRCGFDEARFLPAAEAFLRRPWWSRMWVVQEFALAREEPRWYCGKAWVFSESFRRELKPLQNHIFDQTMPMLGHPDMIANSRINTDEEWGNFWQRRHNMNLILAHPDKWSNFFLAPLMVRVLYRESTDPRDRIFALFEMLDSVSKAILRPDYSQSLDRLMETVSAYLLLQNNRLLFSRLELARSSNLPSWTLDFTRPFRAGISGCLRDPPYQPPIPIDRGILGARGVLLDRLDVLFDLEGARDDVDRIGMLWKLEGMVENHQPADPLSPETKSQLRTACIVPFSVESEQLVACRGEIQHIPFPVTDYIWGHLPFVAHVGTSHPLIPMGFEPKWFTCEKWVNARPVPAFTRVLQCYAVVRMRHGESFFGACCFDLENLKAQIEATELREESTPPTLPDEPGTTGDSKVEAYQPRYKHIHDILENATTPIELKFLKRLLCSLVDEGLSNASLNINKKGPLPSEFLQQLREKVVSRYTGTISSYNEIIETCHCGGEKGESHRSNLRKMVATVEQGQPRTEELLASLVPPGILHQDSLDVAHEERRKQVLQHTSAFITRKGFVGFSFQHGSGFSAGDILAKIYGMPALAVLEDLGDNDKVRLKGFCYVVGVQDEEVEKLVGLGVGVKRNFNIV